jgi:hypothetical protein
LFGAVGIIRSGIKDRRLTAILICALVAIGCYLFYWMRPPTVAEDAKRSYLVMSVVIDSIDENTLQFHTVLKNEGPLEINVSHVVYENEGHVAWEGNLLERTRTMIPGGILVSNSGTRPQATSSLNVLSSYEMSGSDEPITVLYGFSIRTIDLHPHTILYPVSRQEFVGQAFDPTKVMLDAFRDYPIGSFVFWFPEKLPDGTPNAMRVSAGDRRIAFDPISRTVNLTITSNGKTFRLDRSLREGKQGLHYVAATWDESGNVHLYVDGVE